jgi:hypothetical protein
MYKIVKVVLEYDMVFDEDDAKTDREFIDLATKSLEKMSVKELGESCEVVRLECGQEVEEC